MKKVFLDIYYVWVNEFKVVFRDPAVILLLVIVPLFYPLLYAFLYNNEVVVNVKTAVVDESGSSLSREYIRKINATRDIDVVSKFGNLEEAQEAMRRKEVYAIVYIPSSFSRDLNTGKQASILLYTDMGSMLFYKALKMSTSGVAMDMGANIRVAEVGHGTQYEDENNMQPIDYEWVPFYNVPNGFASFLIPAVVIIVIQQTLLLGIGTMVGTHNDKKRFTIASLSYAGKDVNPLLMTVGKAFCYTSIYLVSSAWILHVVPYLFRLPQIGDPLTILLFIFPYIFSATLFAMTISYFCSQREFVVLLIVFTSLPFLFLSGISWPWPAVPDALKALAYLLPSTPGIHGFVKINTMGATLADVKFEYFALWIQIVFYSLSATGMYYWWIANYDPEFKGKHPSKKK